MATERSQKSKALQDAAKNFVMLAKTYKPHIHKFEATRKVDKPVSGWWIYDKIDGVRARLCGSSLYSRTMKLFAPPREWIEAIKQKAGGIDNLDGELVHPAGFQRTVSIVRRTDPNKISLSDWMEIDYVVFDIVNTDIMFAERALRLEEETELSLVPCKGTVNREDSITDALSIAIQSGQEGLILRNPEGYYSFGRSPDLLKVKEFQDIEVTVVDTYEGEGRNTGVIGGLVCKMDSGSQFRVGTGFSDEDRANPPSPGDRVTVRYFELTKDRVPRFPVFIATRDYE